MNYYRQIRRSAIAKRVIAAWVVVFAVAFVTGGCCGYVLRDQIAVEIGKDTHEPLKGGEKHVKADH
ncbi:MAG: hypothetical protein J6B43_02970 [Lachnospiraceae bacterium]|nr:hypothetical protein [Lachnospiraceae bacterium]